MRVTNLIEFVLVFSQEAWTPKGETQIYLHILAADIARIQSIAARAERYNLIACNTGLSEFQETEFDKLKLEAVTICAKYDIRGFFQGDPRGAAFRIECPRTVRHNTMGGSESGFALFFEESAS